MQPQPEALTADDIKMLAQILLDPAPKEFGSNKLCASLGANAPGSDHSDATDEELQHPGCVSATTDTATAAWNKHLSALTFDEEVLMLDDEAALDAPPARPGYRDISSDMAEVQLWSAAEQSRADGALRIQRLLISYLTQRLSRAAYSNLRVAGECKASMAQAQMRVSQMLQYLLAQFSCGAPLHECREFLTLRPIEVLFPEYHSSRQCEQFKDCDIVTESLEKISQAELSRTIAFAITIAIRIIVIS